MSEQRRWILFKERIELASGPNTTEITLTINQDASVRIDGCYAGPEVKAIWGDWDHEFWLTISPGYLPTLLAATLSDAFTRNDRLTYASLVDLLRRAEIPFQESHWT